MFENNYNSKPMFPYASGYYAIFPKGLEKNRKVGAGSLIIEEDYLIYFKPDTPEDIKQRFIKDYAEYHRKQKAEGVYIG